MVYYTPVKRHSPVPGAVRRTEAAAVDHHRPEVLWTADAFTGGVHHQLCYNGIPLSRRRDSNPQDVRFTKPAPCLTGLDGIFPYLGGALGPAAREHPPQGFDEALWPVGTGVRTARLALWRCRLAGPLDRPLAGLPQVVEPLAMGVLGLVVLPVTFVAPCYHVVQFVLPTHPPGDQVVHGQTLGTATCVTVLSYPLAYAVVTGDDRCFQWANHLVHPMEPPGFEPGAFRLQGGCSSQLGTTAPFLLYIARCYVHSVPSVMG